MPRPARSWHRAVGLGPWRRLSASALPSRGDAQTRAAHVASAPGPAAACLGQFPGIRDGHRRRVSARAPCQVRSDAVRRCLPPPHRLRHVENPGYALADTLPTSSPGSCRAGIFSQTGCGRVLTLRLLPFPRDRKKSLKLAGTVLYSDVIGCARGSGCDPVVREDVACLALQFESCRG